MRNLTKQVLQEIERKFKTTRGYILSKEYPVYCPQVNGLTNICLAELGFLKESKNNTENFLNSSSFNVKAKLFYRDVDYNGDVIVPTFNTCKNSVFTLALTVNGFKKEAQETIKSLQKSLAFNKKSNLFFREYNPFTAEINSGIFAQSNLWASLAYLILDKKQKAKNIINSLEKMKKDKKNNLFISSDSRKINDEKRFFLDDQALAILVYAGLSEKRKAKSLLDSVLKSPLYNTRSGLFNSSFSDSDVDMTKSTYKNSLMAFALGKLKYFNELKKIQEGLVRDLYDSKEKLFYQTTKDKTKVPDNSALALVALEYKNIKHKLF